jgi:hypothetical protein
MYLSVYSSEVAAWSNVAVCERPTPNLLSILKPAPGVLVGSVFYFLVHLNDEIVEYRIRHGHTGSIYGSPTTQSPSSDTKQALF